MDSGGAAQTCGGGVHMKAAHNSALIHSQESWCEGKLAFLRAYLWQFREFFQRKLTSLMDKKKVLKEFHFQMLCT